jgi:hypothetical protein
MTLIQIFSYVAYVFGAVFVIGALFLFFNIFRKNETAEEKEARKQDKLRQQGKLKEQQENAGSFFKNRDAVDVALPIAPESSNFSVQEKPPIRAAQRPDPFTQNNPPVTRNNPPAAPVNPAQVKRTVANPNFNKPSFTNNEVDLKASPKEEGKYQFPF